MATIHYTPYGQPKKAIHPFTEDLQKKLALTRNTSRTWMWIAIISWLGLVLEIWRTR